LSQLRVHTFSISLDGDGAGSSQHVDNPLGVRGHRPTRVGACDTYIPSNVGRGRRHNRN